MRSFLRDHSSLFEIVVAITIIILLIGTFLSYSNRVTRVAKEVRLVYELKDFRLCVTLFKALRGNNPGDLKILMETSRNAVDARKGNFRENFLLTLARDSDGYPLDPFGKRYGYNARTGIVSCQSSGYEAW
ncbi:MAG: hypothetical protein ABH865_05315 [Candidatus Omnitrophota bacterium]|nr:hypothetical protein [Candidatus Omnitrophota bacterium]